MHPRVGLLASFVVVSSLLIAQACTVEEGDIGKRGAMLGSDGGAGSDSSGGVVDAPPAPDLPVQPDLPQVDAAPPAPDLAQVAPAVSDLSPQIDAAPAPDLSPQIDTVPAAPDLLPQIDAAPPLCGEAADLLVVFDRSGSMDMYNKWSNAKTSVNNMLTAHSGSIRFGLLLFPHGTPPSGSSTWSGCWVESPQVNVGNNTQAAIMSALNGTTAAGGSTPIHAALTEAETYLTGIDPGKTKYVLLITDGQASCTPSDPIPVVQSLYAKNVRTYIVGFGSGVDTTQLNNMALAGGTSLNGATKYYQANNQTQLQSALQAIANLVTCCGNGVIDTGESCDTQIAPGQPGACPTTSSCDDGDSCTTDVVAGSSCDASCSNTPVTVVQGGDGCCPPGSNSVADSDCPVVCGNGLLESGEWCDPGISSGPGKCPTAADCNDNNVCTANYVSGSGCTSSCSSYPLGPDPTQPDGCCPSGANSNTDKDCLPACGNGVLEQGEVCDPAIGAGAGKCPAAADCDDGDPCTVESVTGGGCYLQCSHAAVQADLTSTDGCCPTGASSLTDKDCAPVCGNGLLEAGESCEPTIANGPGKCPTSADCDDNDVCTTDGPTGSGCGIQCKNTALSPDPAAKDGCCPPGANAATDKDCSPSCGNSVLEPGETCDPKIASGAGKCPTLAECDDHDPCTKDSLSGSACTIVCQHVAIKPDPVQADGCCPLGGNAAIDKDCTAVCGNGVLEPGELCDTAITSGPGKCSTQEECVDGNPCTTDYTVGGGCLMKCGHDAIPPKLSAKDGCCPQGHAANTDPDCPPVCDADLTKNCIDLCKGVTCPPGLYCKEGKCLVFPDAGPVRREIDAGVVPGGGGENWYADGCTCHVGGTPPSTMPVFVGPLVILFLLDRRRRR